MNNINKITHYIKFNCLDIKNNILFVYENKKDYYYVIYWYLPIIGTIIRPPMKIKINDISDKHYTYTEISTEGYDFPKEFNKNLKGIEIIFILINIILCQFGINTHEITDVASISGYDMILREYRALSCNPNISIYNKLCFVPSPDNNKIFDNSIIPELEYCKTINTKTIKELKKSLEPFNNQNIKEIQILIPNNQIIQIDDNDNIKNIQNQISFLNSIDENQTIKKAMENKEYINKFIDLLFMKIDKNNIDFIINVLFDKNYNINENINKINNYNDYIIYKTIFYDCNIITNNNTTIKYISILKNNNILKINEAINENIYLINNHIYENTKQYLENKTCFPQNN